MISDSELPEFQEYKECRYKLQSLFYSIPFSLNKYIYMLMVTGEYANRYENAKRLARIEEKYAEKRKNKRVEKRVSKVGRSGYKNGQEAKSFRAGIPKKANA